MVDFFPNKKTPVSWVNDDIRLFSMHPAVPFFLSERVFILSVSTSFPRVKVLSCNVTVATLHVSTS